MVFIRLPLALASLLIVSSNCYATLKCVAPLSADLCEEGLRYWQHLERDYGKEEIGNIEVHLQVSSTADVHHFPLKAGHSQENLIQIHPALSADNRLSVLKHELSHLYLEKKHPGQDTFIQEAFALWVSKDDVRISLENSEFARRKEALEFLNNQSNLEYSTGSKADRALARVLVHVRSQSRDRENFDQIITQMFVESKDSETLKNEMRTAFQIQVPRARFDFAIWDGAGRLLASEGSLNERFPTGSILKPLLVATEAKTLESRTSRQDPLWFCPYQSVEIKAWTWQEALIHSCNGFFIDSFSGDLKVPGFQKTLKQLEIQGGGEFVSDAIGLIPHQQLSLEEVQKVYRYLSVRAPFIIDVLKETPKRGTLSQAAGADWFVRNNIALKSGSVKDENGQPLHSWIVAIDSLNAGAPRFMSVLHVEGRTTVAVLSELKKRLQEFWWDSTQRAKVQILGLVSENQIEGSCQNNLILEQDEVAGWTVAFKNKIQFPLSKSVQCLTGPMLLKFPQKSGTSYTRPYFGILSFRDRVSMDDSAELRKNQILARRGSRLILETTEREYLFQVIASELPDGRNEAMKALSLVAKSNLKTGWQEPGDICDTTICQVFGFGDRLNEIGKKKIWDAIYSIQNYEISNPKKDWLFFSVGGKENWQETRNEEELLKAFPSFKLTKKIQRKKNYVEFEYKSGNRQISCDQFHLNLRLPSCPSKVTIENQDWIFYGQGRGHGKGLDITKANSLAAQGYDFKHILLKAAPKWKVRSVGYSVSQPTTRPPSK